MRALSLKKFLLEQAGEDQLVVKVCMAAQPAKIELSTSYFDVLILDVVIPRRLNEKATPDVGVRLLEDVARLARLNKPERIIGMTAHLDELASFRKQFEKFCLTVVQANASVAGWRKTIWDAVQYTSKSKGSRFIHDANLQVITVHGIQTFGGWQKRLKGLCDAELGSLPFHSYKFGVFSVPAFFIPFMRKREVKRLTVNLQRIFEQSPDAKFIIFCHSFGTYLVAHALRALCLSNREIPVNALVTAGSVLRSNYDWSYLRSRGIRLVNDCADHDYVLYLSQAFVVGCGMAGKVGFYGTHDGGQTNRYFLGGHSSYFDGDDFMTKYWLPLVSGHPVGEIDLRTTSAVRHLGLDKAVTAIGFFMPGCYLLAATFLVWWVSSVVRSVFP